MNSRTGWTIRLTQQDVNEVWPDIAVYETSYMSLRPDTIEVRFERRDGGPITMPFAPRAHGQRILANGQTGIQRFQRTFWGEEHPDWVEHAIIFARRMLLNELMTATISFEGIKAK